MSQSLPKLYIKTGCPWCDEVTDFFDQKKIPYEKIVVSGNASAMKEMTELSGQSKAPTLDWDGEILADFGLDELLPFLKRTGKIN
jgi:glutaredoxin 3